MPVKELRLALTLEDYDRALAFYRDTLGLPVLEAWSEPAGRVTLLDAGPATLELLDPEHADAVDSLEVGRRVAGAIRITLEVEDSEAVADELEAADARNVSPDRSSRRGGTGTSGWWLRTACS
jgi:lactoylglutathione lyase